MLKKKKNVRGVKNRKEEGKTERRGETKKLHCLIAGQPAPPDPGREGGGPIDEGKRPEKKAKKLRGCRDEGRYRRTKKGKETVDPL